MDGMDEIGSNGGGAGGRGIGWEDKLRWDELEKAGFKCILFWLTVAVDFALDLDVDCKNG